MRPARHARGLTRVEWLLSLLVVALLIGVAAPRLMGRLEHPEVSIARVHLEALNKALQAYRVDVGHYPSEAQGLQVLVQPPADADRARWRGPYFPEALPLDPWGGAYVYQPQGTVGRGYLLYSLGRDHAPGGQGEDADVGR